MTFYYSTSKPGFYTRGIHGDAMPEDAVPITDEKHRALLSELSKGKMLQSDKRGDPIAVDRPPITPEQWTEIHLRQRREEKGETLIKEVPIYVAQADTRHFGVNVGFVRLYNAAFANEPAGVATEFDRKPAGVSLAEIAEVNAYNASACWQWREQALGLKAFYRQLQHTHNYVRTPLTIN